MVSGINENNEKRSIAMSKLTNQGLKLMADRQRTQILVVVLWARIAVLQLVSIVLVAFGEPPMILEASVH